MVVLGINCVYHESSACLFDGSRLIAAAEEERFTRVKHGKAVRADNPDELPLKAIAFCLGRAGLLAADVEHVAIACDPSTIARVHREGWPSPWADPADAATFVRKLNDIAPALRRCGFRGEIHFVAHHLAHAASAFYVSGFAEAAVLVVDALGDDAWSTGAFHGRGADLEELGHVAFPSSLGYLWELVALHLGFGVYDAAKVMGLAAFGDPRRFEPALAELAWPEADGGFATSDALTRFASISYAANDAWLDGLERLFGVPRRRRSEALGADHADIAAALQAATDRLVLHMARDLHRRTGCADLCLAGGVALNCVTNRHVLEHGPFARLFVQPAANDAGLALGAAAHVRRHHLRGAACPALDHTGLGPAFDEAETAAAIADFGLAASRPADLDERIAALVADGRIVALFDGPMEFGPRALGNRSIVADPRDPAMRETLNRKIKHREIFRPLAASILAEQADAWFELGKPTRASDFMLMAYPARPEVRDAIPAVLHEDGTCRIQTVRAQACPTFHRRIAAFHRLTGVPMLLNTSYNDSEPIVCAPRDALATFRDTGIDALAIGPFLLRRRADGSLDVA